MKPISSLFVAWHTETPSPRWGPVARVDAIAGLARSSVSYRFCYTQGARSLEGFQPFDGMTDLDAIYQSDALFPVLLNRLLPKSRPEYSDFLRWNDFNPADPPEPLVLLQRSEGIKKTDAIEVFPCPVPDDHGCYLNYFFVHGMRYQLDREEAIQALLQMRPGDRLTLRCEPDNPVDPFAVAIDSGITPIGYAPRYLAYDLTRLLRDCPSSTVNLFVQKINSDAPFQQRLLCRFQGCWPANFKPCSGTEFELIPELVVV